MNDVISVVIHYAEELKWRFAHDTAGREYGIRAAGDRLRR